MSHVVEIKSRTKNDQIVDGAAIRVAAGVSIIIPTLNAEAGLPATLAALVPAVVTGLLKEVVIVDGGSDDHTLEIAEAAGANIVFAERGRGQQLIAGAEVARGDWLLFLHADTVLEAGWEHEVAAFIGAIERGRRPETAAAFGFALDDTGFMPRMVEGGVSIRCRALGLPYGDQGLLISRQHYRALGGFSPLALMEDVDIVRRLGRKGVVILRTRAVTSAIRYRQDGYLRRILRNWLCVAMFYLGVPERHIVRVYRAR